MARHRLGVALLVPTPQAGAIDAIRAAVGDHSLRRVPAHLTLVPPVNVRADQLDSALALLRDAAAACAPFTVQLGPPTSFLPDNPVLYLPVAGDEGTLAALYALRAAVFVPPLERESSWPYVPHVTLADEAPADQIAAAVAALAHLEVSVMFDRVHLLREENRVWVPIADARFAERAVIGRGATGLELEVSETDRLDAQATLFAEQQWVIYDEERYGVDERAEAGLAITARRSGVIVGTASGWTNGGVGFLAELIVERTRRGEGIGAHVLTAFESACAQRGARRLALRTERDGPAQPFYERRGWHVEAVIREWMFGRDVVQMRKDL